MSRSKLITNLRTCQPIVQQQLRQLSSLSEIRQSSIRTKANASDQITSDTVVVGDGVLANSIAYWLRTANPQNESVTVVESQDYVQSRFNVPSHSQFNSVEAIQLSKFTNQFIRRLNADFKLRPSRDSSKRSSDDLCELIEQNAPIGLLQLCESTAGETELTTQNKLFKKLFGTAEYASELLNSKQLMEMFAWLNTENVRLARHHSRDDLALTNVNLVHLNEAIRKKTEQLGVNYVKGKLKDLFVNNKYEEDVYGVTSLKKNCNEITIERQLKPDLYGLTNLKFKKLIIATSADRSRTIANLLGLNYAWPVEDRQRFIYEIHCKELKDQNVPMIVDSFGLWLRKDQQTGNFYCGLNNQESVEEDENKIAQFSKLVWPRLAGYIASFKKIEIVDVHQQNYDCNLVDDSGIVGAHPDIANLCWVLGFNGSHEIWAPGLGRATSELVNQRGSDLINLEKFGWQRASLSKRAALRQRVLN